MRVRGALSLLLVALCLPIGGSFRIVLRQATSCVAAGCCCAAEPDDSCGCDDSSARRVFLAPECSCSHTQSDAIVLEIVRLPRIDVATLVVDAAESPPVALVPPLEPIPDTLAPAPEPPPPRSA
jgi:hypothetical protein